MLEECHEKAAHIKYGTGLQKEEKKPGRQRRNWKEGVVEIMKSRNLQGNDWEDIEA